MVLSQPPSASEVPITSSWCKRALRPLTSIIVRLEKHWKATPLAEVQNNDNCRRRISDDAKPRPPRSLRREQTRGRILDNGSDSESSPDDPTWVPGQTGRKRIKHRYSGRRESRGTSRSRVVPRSPEVEKLRPGEFTISTPLFLGKRKRSHDGDNDSSTLVGQHGRKPCAEQQTSQYAFKRRSWPPISRHAVPPRDAGDPYQDPGYHTIICGIQGVWNTFLRMTGEDSNAAPRGARSLSAMALSKTSEYILHEQARLNSLDDKDEDVDVADHFITELERTYALSGRGWKPLKTLVRAHGIQLMCKAARNKWIPPLLCRQLVLCANNASAFDAAESLLSALLSTGPAMAPPGRLDSSLFSLEVHTGLNTLHVYTDKTGRRGFMFRKLAELVSSRTLPVEWMATDAAKTFVAGAIQSISSGNEWSVHSTQFIRDVLSMPLGMKSGADDHSDSVEDHRPGLGNQNSKYSRARRRLAMCSSGHVDEDLSYCDGFVSTALSNTVASITTILTASHLARCSHDNDASFSGEKDSPMRKIISLVSTIAQQEIESRSTRESKFHNKLQSLRIGHIFLADYIVNCLGAGHDLTKRFTDDSKESKPSSNSAGVGGPFLDNFEHFLGLVSSRAELVSELSSLVLQISRCWARAFGEDGFSQVKSLIAVLVSRSKITTTATTTRPAFPLLHAVLNKVAVDVALNFAELTCLREHHAWAMAVQETVSQNGIGLDTGDLSTPLTPSIALSSTGFRWEDGIGEWVARSPVLERQKDSRLSHLSAVVVRSHRSPSSRGTSQSSRHTSASIGDQSAQDGSSTAPSSVEDEEDGLEQRVSDGYYDTSEADEPSWPSETKRKSLPARFISGGNKQRKKETPTSRYGLRRRTTVASYDFYVDEYRDDEFRLFSEHLRPSRRGQRRSRASVSSDIPRAPRPRPQAGHSDAEVEVRVPRTPTSAKQVRGRSNTTGIEIVVSPNDQQHISDVPRGKADENPEDARDSGDDDDDDIFVSAPVLRDRMEFERRPGHRRSSPSLPFHEAPSVAVHAGRGGGCGSVTRSLRPRIRSGRGQGRNGNRRREEIPCSRESSEDELSFL